MTEKWTPGWEGCEDAFDLGWKHGTEDIDSAFQFHPGLQMTPDQFEEYKDGYREARHSWD